VVGRFDVDLAPEASGLVVGRRNPGVRWIVDDDSATLLAVGADGTTLGQVVLAGVDPRDVEDIAAGPCGPADPSPCLYVGDIGDNAAVRESILVHRLPEPAPDAGSAPVTTISLTHPGGPVDAEAMIVGDDGVPVVLTKEEGVTRLHRPASFADGEMALLATVDIPSPSSSVLTGFFGLTITAADRSPDGSRVLLRTYDSVVELTSRDGSADLAGLAGWAVEELPGPVEPQGEAVAYLPDGRGYLTVSEQSGDISQFIIRP
jgi:hypothetical protein